MRDYLQDVEEIQRNVDIRNISFFTKYRENPVKGGDPIPEDYVVWTTVGDNYDAVTQMKIKKLMPTENKPQGSIEWATVEPLYRAWKANRDMPVQGTPLAMWSGFTAEDAAYLQKTFSIQTLEQVASMTDGQLARCHISDIRQRVKAVAKFLDANVRRMEIDEGFAERDELIAQQAAQLDELRAQVEAMSSSKEPQKRGPGRPRKEESEAA